MTRRKTILAGAAIFGTTLLCSGALANTHITNGAFDPNEWTVSSSDGTLASPGTTADQAFSLNPSTDRGGAVLYVEQSDNGSAAQHKFGNTLDLMYDYVASPTVLGPTSNASNSSIDVFFEVPNDGDYAIHITSAGFLAFEKPNGVTSPENADGTLHFMDNSGNPIGPWAAFTSTDPDFAIADFHTALGFGASPNSSTPHLIAEFDLSINNPQDPAGGGGLYDPAPAFWSAGGKSGTADPPISSEIFMLQPDGTTLTSPVLNGNGDPVAQPSDVPEPATMGLLAVGIGATMMRRKRRI